MIHHGPPPPHEGIGGPDDSITEEEVALESRFQRIWSLKEAFIKARGDGLGFEPLSRAEFSFDGNLGIWSDAARVQVDGELQTR